MTCPPRVTLGVPDRDSEVTKVTVTRFPTLAILLEILLFELLLMLENTGGVVSTMKAILPELAAV